MSSPRANPAAPGGRNPASRARRRPGPLVRRNRDPAVYRRTADHLERLIDPSLAAGKIVICDRFADSTRMYQGLRGGSA